MTLPNLVVIGAMKAGTTALHDYLGRVPGVFMSDPKEIDFFRLDGSWERGVDWYRDRFSAAGDAHVVGESSPNYTKRHADDGVASRMRSVIPDARLVYLVRHPVDRIVSMYRHLVRDGFEARPFAEAVLDDPDYVETSRYAYQLEPFLEEYPRDRVLVVVSRRLRERRRLVVERVLAFAGLPDPSVDGRMLEDMPNAADESRVRRRLSSAVERVPPYRWALDRSWRLRRVHRRLATRSAPAVVVTVEPAVRAELERRLAPDVARLRAIVGPDFDGWGIA